MVDEVSKVAYTLIRGKLTWIAFDPASGHWVPTKANEGSLPAFQNGIPSSDEFWSLEQRVDDTAVAPVCHRLAFSVEVVGDVIAPLGPIGAEVVAKSTAPTSSRCSLSPGLLNMLLQRALCTRVTGHALVS
jgi:hypothetical protein